MATTAANTSNVSASGNTGISASKDGDDSKTRFCFLVNWFDTHAQLSRQYEFFFYPFDSTIEMYDPKMRRTFLKRSKSQLRLQDLFLGAAVNVHARQLVITDYGDDFTRGRLVQQMESSLLFIKPDGYSSLGKIMDAAIQNQFAICRVHMLQASLDMAHHLLGPNASPQVVQSFVGGRSLALEVLRPNAVETLAAFVGPETVEEAKKTAGSSLRARFGSSGNKNAVHAPTNQIDAKHQLSLIFGQAQRNAPRSATFQNCTLAIIRPHAITEGQTGEIISMIQDAGFAITDMEMYHLDRTNGEDFLEVYKGVVPEYHLMLDQLTSGPLLAMEISGGEDVATKFREFVGPTDPELAKQVRPRSLRAKFGVDKVRNAVHCTDLPEDGILETQYFFRILRH
ncbi:nucleoside diphosphate kinase [Entophlyctis helioformis]|nr:nucleoside diphosphate kinase [Entophlyctis helioformis]